jgi:hypothetical protein
MIKIVSFAIQMRLKTKLEIYRQHKQRGIVCKSQKDRHGMGFA